MKKIKMGFFGGSFNPPSNIHINLAKELVKNKILDIVIFVPVGNYYKKQNLVDAKHRVNMLLEACKRYNYLKVEDIAAKSEKYLYAVDTFKMIKDKYNKENVEIYMIMGSDNFKKMNSWKNYEEIVLNYNYIVIERPNYEDQIKAKIVTYYILNQKEDFSSTRIRHLLEKSENVSNYLDEEVLKYINTNKLYS